MPPFFSNGPASQHRAGPSCDAGRAGRKAHYLRPAQAMGRLARRAKQDSDPARAARRPAAACDAASSSESTIASPSAEPGPCGGTPVATSAGVGSRKPARATTSGGAAGGVGRRGDGRGGGASLRRAATVKRPGDPHDDGGRRDDTSPPSRCSESAPPRAATRRRRMCDPASQTSLGTFSAQEKA